MTLKELYNKCPLTVKYLCFNISRIKRKELSTYFIDNSGYLIIEWEASYKDKYTKVSWVDFWNYVEYLGFKCVPSKWTSNDKEEIYRIKVSYKTSSLTASFLTERDKTRVVNFIIRYIENKDTMRDIIIDDLLN